MKPTTVRTPLYTAIAFATAVGSPAVLAQSDSESFSLEEVVVTARRRSENLQDVPIAVTAISGDALAIKGASDITELAQSVPSVTLEPSRATNSTFASIGMVCRLSTTPITACKGFSSASRDAVNFINSTC